MLYIGSLKGSKSVEQVVRLTLGPIEIWAYSTTHADVIIRKKLSARIGLNNALRILATEYPGGSAAEYIETRNRNAGEHDDGENIFEVISDELITKHKSLIGVHG
jgi:intracellular multiplication protein IcmB